MESPAKRSLAGVAVATAICLALPPLLALGNLSYVPIALLFCAIAALLSLVETREDRPLFLGLFAWAFLARLIALVVLFAIGKAAGGPFLGSDSSNYLRLSRELAASGFSPATLPVDVFGMSGVGVCYLYGAVIRAFGADLFGLQLFNCGLTALIAPLMYSLARLFIPRHAFAVGVLLAFYPSLIVLSATELLKDPSIAAAMVLATWALAKLPEARWGRIGLGLAAVLALTYLRMGRFYIVFYLEAGLLFAVAVRLVHWSLGISVRRVGLAAMVILIFALAESGPARIGWPPSPILMMRGVNTTLNYPPRLRDPAPGLLNRLKPKPAPPPPQSRRLPDPARLARVAKAVGETWRVAPDGGGSALDLAERSPRRLSPMATPRVASPAERPARRNVSRDRVFRFEERWGCPATGPAQGARLVVDRSRAGDATTGPVPVATLRDLAGGDAAPGAVGRASVAVRLANLFRKLYGPFAWVLPARWDTREILTADYPLYPGLLVWYALIPFVAIGLLLGGWSLLREKAPSFWLAALWLVTAVYSAQYLATNLAWRQREAIVPFLVIFAFLGLDGVSRWRHWRRLYILYWAGLAGVACLHLVVRARAAS